MKRWSFEQDAAGRSVIKHNALPRFCAYWTSGHEDLPAVTGLHWQDAGRGDGADCLHVYGIQWRDIPPTDQRFESLMQQAAKLIDDWIAEKL